MLLESIIFLLISATVIIVGAILSLREYKADYENGVIDRTYISDFIEQTRAEEIAKQKELVAEVNMTENEKDEVLSKRVSVTYDYREKKGNGLAV